MRIDKGRRKGFDDSRFREKVEILGAEINLETLRRNITVELVDKLSVSWDERYGQLVTYKEEFGDCNVPRGYLENPKLATWIGTQRQNKKNGNLEVEKIEKTQSNRGFLESIRRFLESDVSATYCVQRRIR